jgi:hypothetical protein
MGSKMSEEKKHTLKESRTGRYCPKCKDYNMDEEGYCWYCHEKTGQPNRT